VAASTSSTARVMAAALSRGRRAASGLTPDGMYDVAVVGGGIVGLAVARELLGRGAGRVAVVERERAVAQHQTGHNSGVVHAGLYYPPGSLKARLCLRGMRLAYEYMDARRVPYRKVGKVVVASSAGEVERLRGIFANAAANGVPGVRWVDDCDGIREIEPAAVGVAAIHSPETGITDWAAVARALQQDIEHHAAGQVLLGHKVTGMNDCGTHVAIAARTLAAGETTSRSVIRARQVVTCAGTHTDRISGLCGGARAPMIVPIRGEYLVLPAETDVARTIRGNIYPVPVPGVPFLGVHFTPTLHGDVLLGPNAVLALSRDGYSHSLRDVSARDVADYASYAGFWRLATRHARFGAGELVRSVFPRAAVRRAQRYVPGLRAEDVVHGGRARAGVRAQAVAADGTLVEDFVFETTAGGKIVSARNAPSPGATSALAIAEVVADRFADACGGRSCAGLGPKE
jgi:(S)-2-hydroxyglutarate dehydrogenase